MKGKMLNLLKQLSELKQQELFFNNTLGTKRGLMILLFLIFGWQIVYYQNTTDINNEHRRIDAGGFTHFRAQHFLYFYYYLDLFPVLSETDKTYSKEGAKNTIDQQGTTLQMEYGHWSRLGESGRIWAFLPDAWLRGSPLNPSIKTFNTLLFLLGLFSVMIGFWRVRMPIAGVILVLLLGSNPFYLYETYANENIFALPTSVSMILLGFYLPIIYSKPSRIFWLIIAVSGLLIAFACSIRAENQPVILSCALVLFFTGNLSWKQKLLGIVVLFTTYFFTGTTIKNYFEAKFQQALVVVEEAGGHPYYGGRIESHRFWHPIFCGLGDFDKKYGYQWNDKVAYNYAIPILKNNYELDLNYTGDKYYLDEYYDEAQRYYKKFDEIDEYEQVVKNKVLADVLGDPWWYVDIVFKRINRILTNTNPVTTWFSLKGMGWLLLPLLFMFALFKQIKHLLLLLFTLPLVTTSILIYSGGNSTYNSPYHLVVLTFILVLLIEFLLLRFRKGIVDDGKI